MLENLGQTDIYLIDQILRGRIRPGIRILDAGCGTGRNSEIFIREKMDIYGVDNQEEAIQTVRTRIPDWDTDFDPSRYQVADLVDLPFPDGHFEFIISSAVLHFATDRAHFIRMFDEMVRVLAPGGYLWIRMTTKHTIAHLAQHLYNDLYRLPDGSTRYLLDQHLLEERMAKWGLYFADPVKTVNVADVRTMAVVVMAKE